MLELTKVIKPSGLNRYFTEHFTQTQENIPSSLNLIEPSPKLTTYSDSKQVSIDTRKLKEYLASYLTTMD